jgi:hypothetical protein
MAITSEPSQKFAFLFTGNTDPRWVADLKKVYYTLKTYYNYPASQIKVVSGGNPLNPLDPGDFTGTTPVQVADKAALGTALSVFISTADASADNTIVLYFTGEGSAGSLLGIKASTETFDPTWLGDNYLMNIVNACTYLIMQQDYSGGFLAAANNIGSGIWTFTASCSNAQGCSGDATQSFFTEAWTKGLQFNISGGKHAYELAPITDPYPTPTAGMMINMKQAWQYAYNIIHASYPETPFFSSSPGFINSYLGLPKLYIRDGNPNWWQSPDIWLSRSDGTTGDLYWYDDIPVTGIVDPAYSATGPYNNTINMQAWNIGTHPVRIYSIAAQLNRSGVGCSDKEQAINDIVPNLATSGMLLPEDRSDVDANTATQSFIVTWNYPFWDGVTHRCARAEVELKSTDVDFSWTITSGAEADIEAQRNLDLDPTSPPPPPVDPGAPEGTGDEIPDEPQNGGEAPGTGTDQGSQTFRGIKEHIYEIKNPFDKTRKFILQFPDDFLKHRKYLAIDWHRMPNRKDDKIEKLEVKISNNLLHLPFKLEKGEAARIKAKLRVGHKISEMGTINLPFNILVQEDRRIAPGLKKRTSPFKGMRSIAGFTVVIWPEAVTLEGLLFDAGKKTLPKTKIRIETSNGQRWVNLITDKYGAFKLSNISPDTYRITVNRGKGIPPEIHMVNMNGGKYRKIELHPPKKSGRD